MHGLMNGPLNKSLHTQKYELLIKCALHSEHTVHYMLNNNESGEENLYATIGNITINVSALSQKANLNHIALDDNDAEKFTAKYGHALGYYNSSNNQKYAAINDAEQHAIQNYTGSEYASINSFLYGKTSRIYPGYFEDDGINYTANRLLLNTAFLSSGLNKIMPETEFSGETFRGESSASFEEIEHRLALIDSDFPVSESRAFISTSFDSYIGDSFSSGSFITFDGSYGKDISGLSHFESENELLVLPNQILWHDCEYKDGTYYFKASVVAPLIEGKDEATQTEIAEFKQLIEFAREHNIDTSFITEYNQPKIETNETPTDLMNFLAELFPPSLFQTFDTPDQVVSPNSEASTNFTTAGPELILPLQDIFSVESMILCDF